jgi:hypothetical protein
VTEEYLTVEQLAQRLGWTPKTVQNKMGRNGIFKKGVHYAQAPGLPVMFKWSAVLELYDWTPESAPTDDQPMNGENKFQGLIPMARGYSMK